MDINNQNKSLIGIERHHVCQSAFNPKTLIRTEISCHSELLFLSRVNRLLLCMSEERECDIFRGSKFNKLGVSCSPFKRITDTKLSNRREEEGGEGLNLQHAVRGGAEEKYSEAYSVSGACLLLQQRQNIKLLLPLVSEI